MKAMKLAAALTGATLLLAGCGGTSPTPAASDAASGAASLVAGGEPLTIGLITNQGNYFFQNIQDALQEMTDRDGGQLLVSNTNNDAGAEAQAIDDFVQRQVDVILISVQSADGSLASIKAADAAGVPVVCYNACVGEADAEQYVKGFIKSDDADLGTQTGQWAAEYIKNELGGKATFAILHCDQYPTCAARRQAFEEELKGLDYTVVTEQEAFLADKANVIAQDMMTAHPEINGFWVVNEGALLGARAAIKANAANSQIPVFGTDISPEIAEMLLDDDNVLQVTTGQNGRALAEAAYEAAGKAKNGETIAPFVFEVPGKRFSRDDVDGVNEYLSGAGQ